MRNCSVRILAALCLLFSVAGALSAAGGLTINSGTDFGVWSLGDVQAQLSATGGTAPYTFSVVSPGTGPLPAGLFIRNGAAELPSFFTQGTPAGIIGVATTPGTFTFTLQVKDASNATFTQAATIARFRPWCSSTPSTCPMGSLG